MEKNRKGVISEAASSIPNGIREYFEGLSRDTMAGIGPLSRRIIGVVDSLAEMVSPLAAVQEGMLDIIRAAGMAGSSAMAMSKRLIEANKNLSLSMNYGISNREVMQMQARLMAGTERNLQISYNQKTFQDENGKIIKQLSPDVEDLAAMNRVFGTEITTDIISKYDRLGKSLSSAAKATGKIYKQAGEYGINLQKYTSNFVDNLEMAQRYNFRNGVNGLMQMARKATEIRQDMRQIASFADKVGTVTGAVETAANLQVLGGAFTQMANPLAMLNESLTNVEGLQDRLNVMAKNAAYYDKRKHEVRMDPTTRILMKRAAEAMGLDANNFIDQAFAETRRNVIKEQMQGLGGLDEKVQKLLPNVGVIDSETGLAGANINGEFKSIYEISQDKKLQDKLIEENTSQADDIKSIAKSVMSIQKMVEGRKEQIRNAEALTKYKDGIINGVSIWDAAFDALGKFDDKTIEAAAERLDFIGENIAGVFFSSIKGFAADLMRPFAAGSMDEFKQQIGDTISNLLPEGIVQTTVTNITDEIADVVHNVSKKIEEYTLKTIDTGFVSRVTASPENIAKESTAVINNYFNLDPNRLLETQAINFSSFQPVSEMGTATAASPVAAAVVDISEQVRQLAANGDKPIIIQADGSRSVTDILASYFAQGQFIRENENTQPTQTVFPSATRTETTAPTITGTQDAGKRDINLNLGGQLQVIVNNSNGKTIETFDLMEMLRQNPNLLRELTNDIAKELERLESNAQYRNK